MFRSVPDRSVRPGASRSRPGRRSDDGHVILLRVQLGLERPVQQVFLDCQSNLNPLPSPCFRTTSSHEDNPASLDQPQTGVSPTGGRTERDDAVARLCWTPAMNSTLRRFR